MHRSQFDNIVFLKVETLILDLRQILPALVVSEDDLMVEFHIKEALDNLDHPHHDVDIQQLIDLVGLLNLREVNGFSLVINKPTKAFQSVILKEMLRKLL